MFYLHTDLLELRWYVLLPTTVTGNCTVLFFQLYTSN